MRSNSWEGHLVPVHKWRIFKTNKQKYTQHTHAEVVATYLHFSLSVVSEHFHQFAATKANLCKISSFFLVWWEKPTLTTTKVEKGTDHNLSRGGGGVYRGYRLCHNKFYLIPYEALWSYDPLSLAVSWLIIFFKPPTSPLMICWGLIPLLSPWKKCDHPKILWPPSPRK